MTKTKTKTKRVRTRVTSAPVCLAYDNAYWLGRLIQAIGSEPGEELESVSHVKMIERYKAAHAVVGALASAQAPLLVRVQGS